MSLNIKDETVHELAREAARRSGRSQTRAVEAALRRYLRDLDSRAADIDALLAAMQAETARGPRLSDVDLYDGDGLPR